MANKRGVGAPKTDYYRPCQSHGQHVPVRIILHSTESRNVDGPADVLAIPAFFQRQRLGYASHLVIDGEGITARLVADNLIGWHCGGRNTGSLGIEQIGSASDTAMTWNARRRGLKQVAKWLAYWSKVHGIPLVLDVNRGVSTHAMQSRAFHTTTHTDPGVNYPLKTVLRWAKWYRLSGWRPNPND